MRRVTDRVLLLATLATLPLLPGCSGSGGEGEASAGATASSAEGTPDAQSPMSLARAEFAVAGMDCGGCVIGTRAALRKLDGVSQADATYNDETGEGTAWADYDSAKITMEGLMAAILELGYIPTLVE